jgi:arsenate reductase (thioredoxin)
VTRPRADADPGPPVRPHVLVVCTGNSCRSQMAEAWVRHDLGDRVEVDSAGTHPCYVHPLAIRVMAEAGVDLSRHTSKSVERFLDRPMDLVVTVCDSARKACPVFPGAKRQIHESIPDPVEYACGDAETALSKFREVRDLVRKRVVARVREALALG